jgi:hypothetical protein
MAATMTKQTRLSDEDLQGMLKLIKDSDSVELKLTVEPAGQTSAVAALGMDPLEAQIRQVYFFDTPDLTLYQQGVVVRARRAQKKGDDSVVKLRPVDPSDLPSELRATRDFGVEVDAMPGGYVCSGSMKGIPGTDVRATVLERRPLRKLFTKAQRAFYADHAPEGLGLDDLSILGPIFVLKLKFAPKGYDRKMVAEMWLYPDNSRILELSTKCVPSEAFQVAAETRAFLSSRGVDLEGEQETKTKRALEFFAKQMKSKQRAAEQAQAKVEAADAAKAKAEAEAEAAEQAKARAQVAGEPAA